MNKIIVIGCPGSGKSTLSKKLHKITNIPLFHLDMIYWKENKTTIDKQEFIDRLSEIIKQEKWIIDGNYASTMELRMKECDTIIFLDYPVDVCLNGVKTRKNQQRSDMPWISDSDDLEFLKFIKNYNQNNKPKVLELLNKYKDKKIYIFTSRSDSKEFLKILDKKKQ